MVGVASSSILGGRPCGDRPHVVQYPAQFQLFLLFPEFTGDAFLDVFGTGENDLSATVGWKNEALE